MSQIDRIVIFFKPLMCRLGKHNFNDKFVGLLYRQCDNCGKNIQVCTPNSYRPSGK